MKCHENWPARMTFSSHWVIWFANRWISEHIHVASVFSYTHKGGHEKEERRSTNLLEVAFTSLRSSADMNVSNIFAVFCICYVWQSVRTRPLSSQMYTAHTSTGSICSPQHFITIIRWIRALSLLCELQSIMQPSFNYCILWKHLLMNCETTVSWCDCTGQ